MALATAVPRSAYDARASSAATQLAPAVSVEGLTKRFATRRSLLDIVRLAKRRPSVTVVGDVAFDVAPGEIFGLLGPNGAGKTTIFKMLATMVAPDAGVATVAGYDLERDAPAVRNALAIVPADERSLNWRLSARQNLELFAALQQLAPSSVAERIGVVLSTVGLSDTGSKRVSEFSSGMRQRLLIARALLTNPRILLLDEPTRTLDPLSARELRRFLREELAGRQGCTILLATHNTDEAFSFCDRVAVLHEGRMLATGRAGELAARFGDERYRLIARGPISDAISALEERHAVQRTVIQNASSDGWTTLECSIPGDASQSAMVLHSLVTHGVDVARLERVDTSLAELISRIISADRGSLDA